MPNELRDNMKFFIIDGQTLSGIEFFAKQSNQSFFLTWGAVFLL